MAIVAMFTAAVGQHMASYIAISHRVVIPTSL